MTEPLVPITPSNTPQGARGKRVLLVMLAIVVLGAIPAVVVPILWTRDKAPHLEDLATIPAFTLVDETGKTFTEEALRGHATIVNFIFTRCDTKCPITSMKMQRIQEKTFGVDKIKLMSISVDPEYDTPLRLTQFAQKYKADPQRWKFITGPKDAIEQLVEGPFMSSMQADTPRTDNVPNIAHAGYFMLVDGDLHIRGRYESDDIQRLDEMIRAARYLARTAK
ncbi:MAG: SCO family protein [Kofleriaceae bacterium]